MNRRSMLGMLGLGAAVGPSVAKEMYATGTSSPAIGYTGNMRSDIPVPQEIPWDPVESLASAKRELAELTGDKASIIKRYMESDLYDYHMGYSNYKLENIDADIRCMKSFSESTKVRMHIERRAMRRYEMNRASVLERIESIIGGMK